MSNHYSAANLRFPGDDARLDFTDLYVFPVPDDPGRTTLIMDAQADAAFTFSEFRRFINSNDIKDTYNLGHPADDVANYLQPWSQLLQEKRRLHPRSGRSGGPGSVARHPPLQPRRASLLPQRPGPRQRRIQRLLRLAVQRQNRLPGPQAARRRHGHVPVPRRAQPLPGRVITAGAPVAAGAAGLVRTVAVAPTLDNVLVLGLIVVIRTFLSFSLETEIEGVAPWRRGRKSGAALVLRAHASTANFTESEPSNGS